MLVRATNFNNESTAAMLRFGSVWFGLVWYPPNVAIERKAEAVPPVSYPIPHSAISASIASGDSLSERVSVSHAYVTHSLTHSFIHSLIAAWIPAASASTPIRSP